MARNKFTLKARKLRGNMAGIHWHTDDGIMKKGYLMNKIGMISYSRFIYDDTSEEDRFNNLTYPTKFKKGR